MPFNTKALKKAFGDLIAPQAFSTTIDDYEVTQSTGGSIHTKVTDPLPAGTNELGSVQLSGSFVRLSTEPTPTAADGVKDGDDLLLVDTKEVYIYYQGTWYLQ